MRKANTKTYEKKANPSAHPLLHYGCLRNRTNCHGFFVPPTGEINGSVLTAYGETLTFAGSLIGIDYHYRYKSKEKDEEDNSDPPLAAL